jgi:translocation and assembly module TamB
MTRRRLAVALVALLTLAGLLRVPDWSRGTLERRASAFFHREVTIGRVQYGLLPLQVEVRDLRVAGKTPADPPFLEVSRLVATPSLTRLLDRQVVLHHVRVEAPRLRIRAFKAGGDDIPKLGEGGPGGELHIGRLVIEGGEVWIDHQRVPLDVDVPEFRGRLLQRGPGVLAGHVALGPGPARFGTAPVLSVATEADLALQGGVVRVETARLTAEKTDVTYRGQIRLRPLGAELALEGPVDLGIIDRHVVRTGFDLEGDAQFKGTASIESGKLRLRGRMSGTAGLFDGIAVPSYEGEVAWDEKGVRLSGLETTLLGGTARFDVDVPPGVGPARVRATLRGVDGEPTVGYLFDVGPASLGTAVTGEVDVHWPRGRVRELTGRVDVELAGRSDGRVPLEGRLTWRATDGAQVVEESEFRTPNTQARLRGAIALDKRTDLEVDARSTDLAASDLVLTRLRRALGTEDAEPVGLSGSGTFQGRWRGRFDDPVFQGRVSGADVGYLGVVWGQAEGAGELDVREVRPRSIVLRRAGSEMWIDGTTRTGDYGDDDAVDVRVRLVAWPAADLVKAFEWDLDVTGPITGEATVRGRRSAPEGTAHLSSPDGVYYGVPFQDMDVRAVMKGRTSEVTAGRARVGGGQVTFSGTLSEDGMYDGRGALEGVEIGTLLPSSAEPRWGGRVSGQVVMQGPLARPRLAGDLHSPSLSYGAEAVGALEAHLTAAGDGSVTLDARARSPRLDVRVAGPIGVSSPFPARLRLRAEGTSLDPFLRASASGLPANVAVVASGDGTLEGPLSQPEALAGGVSLRELRIEVPDFPIRNEGTVDVRLAGGHIEVRRLALSGEGTDLTVAGGLAAARDGALDLDVRGAADLRALSLLSPDLRGRGAARVEVRLTGRRSAPVVDGTLDVHGAGVRLRGFPHGIDDLDGRVAFNGQAAHLSGMKGTVGGGPVELEGQASYAGGRLVSFDVQATGRGLALRYPEGLKSVVDTDLRLLGDASQQWLTGNVTVRQAAWTRRYDVASELLAGTAPVATSSSSTAGTLRYDVKVQVPGTLKIDNNLATLQARADLTLQGTIAAPAVLGRAEIDRGRVYFQGNTYVIRRGTIDFANPTKIEPSFDIEAEARIRSYNVLLKVNGTLDRVYPTLTSDPPLSTVAILNLLSGADEDEVQRTALVGSDRVAAAGAASLAAGRLAEEFGLEKGAARLGLSRFSIDPAVVSSRGELTARTATARMTLGKRITPDLNVVYSQDLRGAEERLIAVEYTLSDKLSLLLTRVDQDYGFDLRLRQSR